MRIILLRKLLIPIFEGINDCKGGSYGNKHQPSGRAGTVQNR